MTTATKAIAGIGGLLTTTAVPSIYLTVSSSSNKGEETATVDNRPNGKKWLLNSDYTFNKPSFKSQDHLGHGCSENLFSNNKEESNPEQDTKVYGCAVMNMDLGNTGVAAWAHNDPKWIKFNSEVAVRKGGEGWVINSRVDNWSGDATRFDYALTTYKYKNNNWVKEEGSKTWFDALAMGYGDSLAFAHSDPTTGATIAQLNIYREKLVIKVPKEYWFNEARLISPSHTSRTKTKQKIKNKTWSGVWIDDADKEGSSWIFEDIELYVGEKQYSQLFCKGEKGKCFQSTIPVGTVKKFTDSVTWHNAISSSSPTSEKAKDLTEKTMKEIIDKLTDSKGTWMKLEDICDAKIDETTTEERKKQLRMYCSNGKQIN